MKIVLYNDYKVGLLKDGQVVDVSGVVPRGGTPQLTIEGLITNFQSLQGALARALEQGEVGPAFPGPPGAVFPVELQGRDLWLVTMTNKQTDPALGKPAYSFRTCASAASAWGSQNVMPIAR